MHFYNIFITSLFRVANGIKYYDVNAAKFPIHSQ